jgi:hypothetical protein
VGRHEAAALIGLRAVARGALNSCPGRGSTAGSYASFAQARSGDLQFVAWSEGAAGARDLRAVAVTSDGMLAPGWSYGGSVVCGESGDQVLTSLAVLPPAAVLAVWEDRRTGESDIRATLLQPGGPATVGVPDDLGPGPLAFTASSPTPNPARDHVQFAFVLVEPSAATLEIVDVAGRVLARLEAEPPRGAQAMTFDAGRLSPGLYWAKLRQGVHVVTRRFAVVH